MESKVPGRHSWPGRVQGSWMEARLVDSFQPVPIQPVRAAGYIFGAAGLFLSLKVGGVVLRSARQPGLLRRSGESWRGDMVGQAQTNLRPRPATDIGSRWV